MTSYDSWKLASPKHYEDESCEVCNYVDCECVNAHCCSHCAETCNCGANESTDCTECKECKKECGECKNKY
jgi:hypothetical protein